MTIPSDSLSADALLHEVDTRLAQALDNFFQRSRSLVQEAIVRAIAQQMNPSTLGAGQSCLDWLNTWPDELSTAFAAQFRSHLSRPETSVAQPDGQPTELELVDDARLALQLAEDKAVAQLIEALRPEMMLLFGRLRRLRRNDMDEGSRDRTDLYGPRTILRALSHALDSLGFDPPRRTLMVQCVADPLRDTLRHTYTALNQYLDTQGVEADRAVHPRTAPAPPPQRRGPDIGQEILDHLRSVASPFDPAFATGEPAPAGTPVAGDGAAFPALLPDFSDRLKSWQSSVQGLPAATPGAPALVLRQLQEDARHTDAGAFDLAMLDAVAGLFEFILEDSDLSTRYKSAMAQLQIPLLRTALAAPDFFSDDHHPARQLIDLLGRFSRRFPERTPSHSQALAQIETACTGILDQPDDPAEAFARAHGALTDWLGEQDARGETGRAADVAELERIERQELGTLLALENLHDLSTRYPAPESVLGRLEAAWVPYMASLYLEEAGEGPRWRSACATMLQLFLSLQPPDSDETRETRLRSIPQTSAELRHGLLAQGAEPSQLKDFFRAITATQECWVRPGVGRPQPMVAGLVAQPVSLERIQPLAHQLKNALQDADPIRQQAWQLQEGDWVDFDPPREGLATARVAWVGVHGYMLFCDSAGEQRFSLDSDRLAEEVGAGRAQIPEQSLTRKAMLRLKTRLSADSD